MGMSKYNAISLTYIYAQKYVFRHIEIYTKMYILL